MHVFKDSAGREWRLELNVASVGRLKDAAQADLCALDEGEPPLATRLLRDAGLLGKVLCELTRTQRAEKGVDDNALLASLDGPALGDGLAALSSEVLDFFHPWCPSVIRPWHQALLGARLLREPEETGTVGPEDRKTVEEKAGTPAAVGDPSGGSPGSSGSIPPA